MNFFDERNEMSDELTKNIVHFSNIPSLRDLVEHVHCIFFRKLKHTVNKVPSLRDFVSDNKYRHFAIDTTVITPNFVPSFRSWVFLFFVQFVKLLFLRLQKR